MTEMNIVQVQVLEVKARNKYKTIESVKKFTLHQKKFGGGVNDFKTKKDFDIMIVEDCVKV